MDKLSYEQIGSPRIPSERMSYIGAYTEPEEPTDLAQWYQWNQHRLASHAAMHGVITSDSTRMVEVAQFDENDNRTGVVHVYADPTLGIQEHVKVLAVDIENKVYDQAKRLDVQPELTRKWYPLGSVALPLVIANYDLE
jgi:hypothetical protein